MESGFSKAYTSLSMKFLNVGDHLYWFLNVSFVFNVVHASSVESCFGHRDKAMEEVRMCLKTLESVLKGMKFFGGDTIGLLDIQQDSGLDFLTADECPVLIKCCEDSSKATCVFASNVVLFPDNVSSLPHGIVFFLLDFSLELVFGTWASPFSRGVELALRLEGVPYEYIEEDIYKNKSPLLFKYNPVHKKVPVLLHNEKPIAESLVILEYIEETWKNNPILPQDSYEKAMARFWAKFIGDKCWTAIRKPEWSPESEREKAMEEACECLKALESALNGNKFYGGHTIGLVDIAANFTGFWLSIVQEATGNELLSAHKFPLLFNWSHCGIAQECLLPQRQ
ncbi:hypothetical protein Gohar_020574, partial [Gossypium harknessii]|nr:hypothetical protein [Gossypium harknessii]